MLCGHCLKHKELEIGQRMTSSDKFTVACAQGLEHQRAKPLALRHTGNTDDSQLNNAYTSAVPLVGFISQVIIY